MSAELSSILIAVIAGLTGSGVCSIVVYLLQRKDKQKETRNELCETRMQSLKLQSAMLLGLGHDRIIHLGLAYIKQGYISRDEYENLHTYLYEPYLALGGNGTAKKVMAEVQKLPFHEN